MESEFEQYEVKPEVLTYEDVIKIVPKLKGHEKLVNRVMHWLKFDEVNRVHSTFCDTPGPEFVHRMVPEDFRIKVEIDNEEVLDRFKEGPFITISNHPFGSLDGILLIDIITRRRPKFKVMVNMILNQLTAMRPNFIAVDAMHSDDPEKRRQSVHGIRETLRMLRSGEPVGFFPAGCMSKIGWDMKLHDEEWKETVLSIIQRAKVPVIPVFFHGTNRFRFNIMGRIWWIGRTLMLPSELFHKRGSTVRVSIGEPIMPEEQAKFATPKELGAYLRKKTYELRDLEKK